jgi:hypothetical protein
MSGESAARPKVFGVGLMKTGTTTLGGCLTTLGYRHRPYYPKLIRQRYHGDEGALWDVAARYESFEDHPWPDIFRELDDRFPDARFILTVRRDSATWFRSLEQHAKRMGPTAERLIIFGYGWPGRKRAEHIEHYEAHNDAVRAHFADRPDRLLEVCWETGSTWEDVAAFLGHELPPVDGPRKQNAAESQSVSPRFWLRNSVKYVVIGRLKIDPFRYRNFTA